MNRIGLLGLIVSAVFFGGWAMTPGSGKIEQVDISGNDVGPLLGAQVAKFRYTLQEGSYDSELWLEQQDADSTQPKRLKSWKGVDKGTVDGGIIWVSLTDLATTKTENDKAWKLVISRQNLQDGKSTGTYASSNLLIKNPFDDLPEGMNGVLSHSTMNREALYLREEVTLMEWAGGPPTENVNGGGYTNFRHVYLKMKVMPHGELFPE